MFNHSNLKVQNTYLYTYQNVKNQKLKDILKLR